MASMLWVLYGRLPFAKVFLCVVDRLAAVLYPALYAVDQSLLAPMKSADLHLIPATGCLPREPIQV
jgi:hypothetical protein